MNLEMSPSASKSKSEGLTFAEALDEIVAGKKVAKAEWENDDYGFMRAEILHIHRDGQDHRWIISLADIVGTDYKVLSTEILEENINE